MVISRPHVYCAQTEVVAGKKTGTLEFLPQMVESLIYAVSPQIVDPSVTGHLADRIVRLSNALAQLTLTGDNAQDPGNPANGFNSHCTMTPGCCFSPVVVFPLDMCLGSDHHPRNVGRDTLAPCSLKKRVSAFSELFSTKALSPGRRSYLSGRVMAFRHYQNSFGSKCWTLVLRNGGDSPSLGSGSKQL